MRDQVANRRTAFNATPLTKPLVLFIITRSEHGGAQSHVLSMMRCLTDRFKVHLAVGEQGFLLEACRESGIPVHFISALRRDIHPVHDLRALAQTIRLLRRLRPDLIHAHTTKAGLIGRLAARLCSIPSVYTAHSWNFTKMAPWGWRVFSPLIERLAAKWTSRIITVSHDARAAALKLKIANDTKLITIHNGVPDLPTTANPMRLDPPVIAMVARFTSIKDHDTIVRAVAALNSSARLMLIGDGPRRNYIEDLVDRLGLRDRVEFLGDRDDVPELLSRSSVFVLSSKFENLPISMLEAMRAGLPVVATNVGGMPEAVINGQTGYIVPVGSVTHLTEAIAAILSDHELRVRMGRASRALFLQAFLEHTMVEHTIAVYDEVQLKPRAVNSTL